MTGFMALQLSGQVYALLQSAGKTAADRGEKLYLVGGAVRDLLLRRVVRDFDLVVEGNGPELAAELARETSARITVHRRFGTATLAWDGLTIDIATARSETYPAPGALPIVKPGNINDDLFRRDFSINAIAVSLLPDNFGSLIDPCGGIADLQQKSIRVLHEQSFRDDPTRIWRAVRYEQRLDFNIESNTMLLLARDLPVMDAVSGDRIRHELMLVLAEEYPEKALRRAAELSLLKQIGIDPVDRKSLPVRFALARERYDEKSDLSMVYLSILCCDLHPEDIPRVVNRLNMPKKIAAVLHDMADIISVSRELANPGLPPGRVYELLHGKSSDALLAAAICLEPIAAEQVQLYLDVLRNIKISLTGDDLSLLGVPKGPRRTEILNALKNARLDGIVNSKAEEEALVKTLLGNKG